MPCLGLCHLQIGGKKTTKNQTNKQTKNPRILPLIFFVSFAFCFVSFFFVFLFVSSSFRLIPPSFNLNFFFYCVQILLVQMLVCPNGRNTPKRRLGGGEGGRGERERKEDSCLITYFCERMISPLAFFCPRRWLMTSSRSCFREHAFACGNEH